MRSISKQSMAATFIILCTYTQFTEARPQTKGRLVLKTNSIAHITKLRTLNVNNPCRRRRSSGCGQESVDNIEEIKNIGDLGFLFDLPNGPGIVVEEASIEIYSKEDKLVFSTEAKCDGCGKKLSSKTTGNSTSYLLALDKIAVSAAQPHFVKGHKLVVTFKAKGKNVPDTLQIVKINIYNPCCYHRPSCCG
jgi:hypothetical protein